MFGSNLPSAVTRHALILCAMALLLLPGGANPQDSTAAAEAEWTTEAVHPHRGDPYRDDDLRMISSSTAFLHGAGHLSRFLEKWHELLTGMDRQTDGPITVVHMGGSHVQAGRIGWAFRNQLLSDFPGLVIGHGIQPPYRLTGTNGPPERGWTSSSEWTRASCAHRRHEGEWGLTGIEAQCIAPEDITCWSGDPAGELCCPSFRVFNRPETHGAWRPTSTVQSEAVKHACGIVEWKAESGNFLPDTMKLTPAQGGPVTLHGVEWIPQDADLVYHDIGANGAHSASWLRNPHFSAQLSAISPDLVILAFGINDAHMAVNRFDPSRFKRHYRALLDTIRGANPGADILLVTNNDSHYRSRHNPNAERVRAAMKELVQTERVACWDLYGQLGGKGSIDRLRQSGFAAEDRLHMRRDGYVLIGELLYGTLVRSAAEVPPLSP